MNPIIFHLKTNNFGSSLGSLIHTCWSFGIGNFIHFWWNMQKGRQSLCLMRNNHFWMPGFLISLWFPGSSHRNLKMLQFFTETLFPPSTCTSFCSPVPALVLNCLISSSLLSGFIAKYNHGIRSTAMWNFPSCNSWLLHLGTQGPCYCSAFM